MSPTAHDITPAYLSTAIIAFKNLLNAGNNLLIVTKPHMECVQELCEELQDFKEKILFRFTITTMNEEIAAFWEPGARPPEERVISLRLAFEAGYQTSVSAEPMLGTFEDWIQIYAATQQYITETIWYGKLNKPKRRITQDDPAVREMVQELIYNQRNDELSRLYGYFKNNPRVKFKNSIREALGLDERIMA